MDWNHAFESWPRPLLRWACLFVLVYTIIEIRDTGLVGVILAFITAVYGIRAAEKIKAIKHDG